MPLLAVMLAASAVVLAIVSSQSSVGATAPVAVYPSQGTPVASPRTQVSFRGAPIDQITGVTVTGSRTGAHSGHLAAHSDGQGASFVADKPFAPGETVTVRAGVPLVGARNGALTFTIATFPKGGKKPGLAPDPGGTARESQHFHSAPSLEPPGVKVIKHTSASAPGYLFVGAKAGRGQDGPMIVDQQGHLVWYRRVPRHTSALDFRPQELDGKPVLTWWQGGVTQIGEGQGVGIVLDSSYRQIATVRAGNGYAADLHELQLTPRGTALLLAYVPVQWDLRGVHGPRAGRAIDVVVQEVDLKTGLVEFEWHSLGHIDVKESYAQVTKGVLDGTHVNSVGLEPDGNFLVSARNTDALYEVDRASGAVLWRLGGKRSSFKMARGTQFLGQHDARRQADGSITVFDNGAPPLPGRPSRALQLRVDQARKTVTLVHAFRHPRPALRTFSQGSVQQMTNGNLFVGWGGSNPWFTEFDPRGHVVFDAQFRPTGDDTYRAYKLPWSATPAAPPAIAATVAGGRTTAYASWNGATGVASWQLLAGTSPTSLQVVQTVPSQGFETTLGVAGSQPFVQVNALDATGKVIGSSKAIAPAH